MDGAGKGHKKKTTHVSMKTHLTMINCLYAAWKSGKFNAQSNNIKSNTKSVGNLKHWESSKSIFVAMSCRLPVLQIQTYRMATSFMTKHMCVIRCGHAICYRCSANSLLEGQMTPARDHTQSFLTKSMLGNIAGCHNNRTSAVEGSLWNQTVELKALE